MEPEVHSSAESLRAHARAIRAASGELRGRARALREHSRKLCAETAALRARLSDALELTSPDGRRPREREQIREGLRTSQASVLIETAEAVEHTARLAERHAAREQAAGRSAAADHERAAARRAHAAAVRGRELARHDNPGQGSGQPLQADGRSEASQSAGPMPP